MSHPDLGAVHLIQHDPGTLYELFHENTKLSPATELKLSRTMQRVLGDPSVIAMMTRGGHRFPNLQRIELQREVPPTGCTLDDAVLRRRSVRDFTAQPLTLTQLNQMLTLGYRVTGRFETAGGAVEFRSTPSAGGLYPVELYLVARGVDGLEPGIYHYNVPDHTLEHLPAPPDLASRLHGVSHYAETVTGAAALIVMTAVFQRSIYKYGDRGYRFILLEAGHAAQNVLLTATALDLGAVAVGGFRDNLLSDLVEADGMDEAALYMLAVGRPGPAPG